MHRLFNHRTIYASLFYMLSIILVMLVKPAFMFDENGNVKQFGVGTANKTIISLGVINGVAALLSFYIFTIIDVVFTPKNTL